MKQYIVFAVNKQNFAVNISEIERIIEAEKPKETPETSEYFLGVTQYSGRILPIIDLSMRLYRIPTVKTGTSKVIVTLWKENFVGLLVDDVIGVQNFRDGQFEDVDQTMNLSKEYMAGFIKEEDDIIIVLNVDRIFQGKEEERLMLAIDN